MKEANVRTPRPVVINEEQCELEAWDDPTRGKVRWRTLLSGDRTPTSAMTVGVAEVEAGHPNSFHPHRHEPAEVYYILEGEGIVSIDNVDHRVRAGSTVFIPGNAWHCARNTGAKALRLLYIFAVDSFADVTYVFPDRVS
jgi:mannose-6-phosphate isomerase-like protein (cupin superfamily)